MKVPRKWKKARELKKEKEASLTLATLKDSEDALVRSGHKYHADDVAVVLRRASSNSHRAHTAAGAARVESPLTAYSHWLHGKFSGSKGPQVTIVPFEQTCQESAVERERPVMLQLSSPAGKHSDE